MIKLHYAIASALDECLADLEQSDGTVGKVRRRSVLLEKKKAPAQNAVIEHPPDGNDDDEYEAGFDGVMPDIPHGKR